MPAARLGLLDDRDRHLAQPLHRRRVVGQQLEQPVGARQAGRAAADDGDADLDELVLGVELALDELVRRVDRRREFRRDDAAVAGRSGHRPQPPFFAFTASVSLGRILLRSPTMPEVGELEDRRVRVLVDRDDVLRGLHADLVLDRAGDAGGQVELRRDGLARLADLRRVRVPAGVDHRAGGGDGAAQAPWRAPRRARSPRPCPGRGRRRRGCRRPRCSTSAPRCSPRWTIVALVDQRRELDVDVLDGRPRRRRTPWPRTRSGAR